VKFSSPLYQQFVFILYGGLYMPFHSTKQRGFLWKNKPEIAKKWTEKYGSKIVKKSKDEKRKSTKSNKRNKK